MSPEEFARGWVRLDRVFDIEAKCRAAFDNEFHKIPASMTYDQWRLAFKTGWRESAAHPKELQPATVQLVDAWFSLNTGLGGCSDEDVAALAAIFYGTNPPPLDFDQQLTMRMPRAGRTSTKTWKATARHARGRALRCSTAPILTGPLRKASASAAAGLAKHASDHQT